VSGMPMAGAPLYAQPTMYALPPQYRPAAAPAALPAHNGPPGAHAAAWMGRMPSGELGPTYAMAVGGAGSPAWMPGSSPAAYSDARWLAPQSACPWPVLPPAGLQYAAGIHAIQAGSVPFLQGPATAVRRSVWPDDK
jgi:hypothetical protein